MYPTLDNVKILSFPRIPSKLPDILKYVKNNLKQLPRKRVREIDGPSKPRKRKADEDIDDLMSTSVLAGETKSLKLFLDAMAEKFKITDHVFTLEEWKEIKQVLSEIYNKLKWTALECLRSCGNVFSAFIAGFFMQNSFQAEFKKRLKDEQFYLPVVGIHLKNERTLVVLSLLKLPGFQRDLDKFINFLKELNQKYSGVIDIQTGKLTNDATTILYLPPDDPKKFKCIVCFQMVSITRKVTCGYENSKEKKHEFCLECLRGQARATIEEMPLADGAVGLKCMDFECKNAVYYEYIRKLLPKDMRKKMDIRIQDENIALSGIELDRCKKCNFAVELPTDRTIEKMFECVNCDGKWCRLCGRKWEDDHVNLTCEELDKLDHSNGLLDTKMSEAIVRKCQRCNFQFTKTDGCNKITCRCGLTICYLCRKHDVTYRHFCQHGRDEQTGKCNSCNKCGLWSDSDLFDQEILKNIQNDQEKQAEDDATSIPDVTLPDLSE
uniref:RING-type domain-containing protein n=1 Tax=Panagrolaimus sp. JU765 TaxID=591449 RepID=A0AC34R5H9_9BILA